MIEEALLRIVLVCQLARLSFEIEEVNEGHRIFILSDLLTTESATCMIQLVVATTHDTVTVVFAVSVMELALRSKSREPIKVKSPFQICGNAARALPENDASKVVP